MSTGREERGGAGRRSEGRKAGAGGLRAPGWVVPIVAAASGWFFGGWVGALFGAVMGTFIWRSR